MQELDEYLAGLLDKAKRTRDIYEKALTEFVSIMEIDTLEEYKLIKSRDVMSKFVKAKQDEGLKNSTINADIRSIRAFNMWLLNNEYIDSVFKIKELKVPKDVHDVLTNEERDKMFRVCKTDNERLMLALMFYTGSRKEETVNIKVADVDFKSRFIKIRGKGNKQRKVPMNEFLYKLTAEFVRNNPDEEYLIVSDRGGGKLTNGAVAWRINAICERAGIKEKSISPHSLRRSFAHELMENGVDGFIIQQAMGHANFSTTEIYLRGISDKSLNRVVGGQTLPEEQ